MTVDVEERSNEQRCDNLRSQKMEVLYTILDLITCSNTKKHPKHVERFDDDVKSWSVIYISKIMLILTQDFA
jgi:hypothetical protein